MNIFLHKHSKQIIMTLAIFIALAFLSNLAKFSLLSSILWYIAGIIGTIPIISRAYASLRAKVISIELLVSIATIGALAIGEPLEAAIVTFLFLFGDILESRTLAKTRNAVKSLTEMAPEQALVVLDDGTEELTDVDDLDEGDNVKVIAGDQIPVDGNIISGEANIVESAITGESVPVNKSMDDKVFAGTTVDSGSLIIETTAVSEDTTFGKIIELVENAQDAQAPVAKFIDKFAKYYTPAVLIIAIIVGLITKDIRLAITMLVLGCPGALVIGAPVANVAGIGHSANKGILFKGGSALSSLSKIDTLLLDKTGTITTGKMNIDNLYNVSGKLEDNVSLLAGIEKSSNHPIAKAISAYAEDNNINVSNIIDVNTIKGRGLSSKNILAGNVQLMLDNHIEITSELQAKINEFQQLGDSIVVLAVDKDILLIAGVNDIIRKDAREGLELLRRAGIRNITMLTGDNEKAAKAIATQLGIDYRAELLPDDKVDIVKKYMTEGHTVGFVGDGINDAPALATADVGIGMGGGTAVALDTADVVLVKDSFDTLASARRTAKKTTGITTQNIVIAVATVVLLLLGLLVGIVQMGSGMFVHEISILLVIFNAMRLLK